MKEKIRVGIVGCGVIAPTHVESFLNLPEIEIVGLCDLVLDKCKRLVERYNLRALVYEDYRKMFEELEIDAVSICTDHASHSSICCEAFNRGIHVLCEKPLASDLQGLEAMISAYKENKNLVFEPVFQNRFNPLFIALREIVQKGAFGKLLNCGIICNFLRTNEYYIADRWRGTWKGEGGSALINQAIHYLDLMLWICGRAKRVLSTFSNLVHEGVIETEDTLSAILELESGAQASVSVCSGSVMEWENILWINGTDGYLSLRNGIVEKIFFKDAQFMKDFEENRNSYKIDNIIIGKSYYGNLHFRQISDFCDSIKDGHKPFIDVESAAETVRTVFRIYDAGRKK